MNEFMQRMFFGGPSQTEVATKTDGLFMLLWWYGVFWFVLLMGLMVFWVIKYRRRPGVPAPVSAPHNTRLEVFWTVVPSSSLLLIFLLGFWGYMEKLVPTGDAMQLEVTAQKWAWDVVYPGGEKSKWIKPLSFDEDIDTGTVIQGKDYPIFVVPEDTNFSLRMISADVIHSFWIPELRVKMDVFPNRYTGFVFKTPELNADDEVTNPVTGLQMPGRDLYIFCAEYCGNDHSQMAGTLRVVPKGDYEKWIVSMGVKLPPAELGASLWKTKCSSCHSNNGTPNVGPTWSQATYQGQQFGYGYPVRFTDGTSVAARDDNYIRESILSPSSKIVDGFAGTMTPFQGLLTETEISGLITYYKTLSDIGQAQLDSASSESAEGEADETEAGEGDESEDTTTPADDAATQEHG